MGANVRGDHDIAFVCERNDDGNCGSGCDAGDSGDVVDNLADSVGVAIVVTTRLIL